MPLKTSRAFRSLAAALLLWGIEEGGSICAEVKEDESNWSVIAEKSERILKDSPQDETAWANLVEARLKQEDLKRAERAFNDWTAKVSRPSPNADRLRGMLAFASDKVPDAIEAWHNYLAHEPKDIETWNKLVAACERQHDWDGAIDAMSALVKLEPSALFLSRRANFRIRVHDWTGAETDVREANRLDASEIETQRLFPIFERSREWKATIAKLDQAIEQNPKNASLLLDRAEWLIGIGFVTAGEDDIAAAYQLAPQSLRARIWRGILAWEAKGSQDSEAVSKNANWPDDVLAISMRNVTSAFEAELKTMDASPDREARARFLLKNHQPILAFKEAQTLDGSVSKVLALIELKRFPEAGLAARRCVEVNPANPEAWIALARLEEANGNLREALSALDRSTKLKKSAAADELRKSISPRLEKP